MNIQIFGTKKCNEDKLDKVLDNPSVIKNPVVLIV